MPIFTGLSVGGSSGLIGQGNWCRITAVTGSPATGTYTDGSGVTWKWYRWTGNGSITNTAGMMDVLVVGGGGNGATSANGAVRGGGGGGEVIDGVRYFSGGTTSVTVGGSPSNSVLGSLTALRGQNASSGWVGEYVGGNGYGGRPAAVHTDQSEINRSGAGAGLSARDGFISSITGSSYEYAIGGLNGDYRTNYGSGGGNGGESGRAGVIIVRVPLSYAIA